MGQSEGSLHTQSAEQGLILIPFGACPRWGGAKGTILSLHDLHRNAHDDLDSLRANVSQGSSIRLMLCCLLMVGPKSPPHLFGQRNLSILQISLLRSQRTYLMMAATQKWCQYPFWWLGLVYWYSQPAWSSDYRNLVLWWTAPFPFGSISTVSQGVSNSHSSPSRYWS